VIGIYQAIDGLSTEVTTYAFAGVASVLNLWVIVIGVNMWRRSKPIVQTPGDVE
jgi:hypothetical protein